ncbi:hypothetical protein [Microbispora sp. NPDC049125]|uniref:hypothetical protein n=1 Tax=Microbispora sp. NPDC049125 TaxID=3154929 RepID=UPI0034650D4A
MTRAPYTFVNMSMDPGQRPRISVSFYTSGLRLRARVLESGRPYLALESDEVEVSVSTTGAGPVTTADVEVARQIFNAAARYLADCQRLHAESPELSDSDAQAGNAA